jgi:hypothetical protein
VTRRFRFLTVLLSLVALLMSNAALAGYACPGSDKAAEIAEMAEMGAPCSETMSRAMDDEHPGLCHAHCQSGDQSADTFHPPAFAGLMELGAVLSLPLPAQPIQARRWLPPSLPRATGPPLAVQYCCFRT